MILCAVAAEQSPGRLFLAGIGPGVLRVALFSACAVLRYRKEYAAGGKASAMLDEHVFSFAEKVEMLPRVLPRLLPFVILLIGVMVAL